MSLRQWAVLLLSTTTLSLRGIFLQSKFGTRLRQIQLVEERLRLLECRSLTLKREIHNWWMKMVFLSSRTKKMSFFIVLSCSGRMLLSTARQDLLEGQTYLFPKMRSRLGSIIQQRVATLRDCSFQLSLRMRRQIIPM